MYFIVGFQGFFKLLSYFKKYFNIITVAMELFYLLYIQTLSNWLSFPPLNIIYILWIQNTYNSRVSLIS